MITLCYLLSDGLSLLQKRAALPFVSGPACQVSPAGGGCGGGKSVAQGLLLEEGKRSLWYLSFREPAWAHCFEYFGLEAGSISPLGWRQRDAVLYGA